MIDLDRTEVFPFRSFNEMALRVFHSEPHFHADVRFGIPLLSGLTSSPKTPRCDQLRDPLLPDRRHPEDPIDSFHPVYVRFPFDRPVVLEDPVYTQTIHMLSLFYPINASMGKWCRRFGGIIATSIVFFCVHPIRRWKVSPFRRDHRPLDWILIFLLVLQPMPRWIDASAPSLFIFLIGGRYPSIDETSLECTDERGSVWRNGSIWSFSSVLASIRSIALELL